MVMLTDLGLALALMNGAWPDLELLPVEERPISRETFSYFLTVPIPPDFVHVDLRWSYCVTVVPSA